MSLTFLSVVACNLCESCRSVVLLRVVARLQKLIVNVRLNSCTHWSSVLMPLHGSRELFFGSVRIQLKKVLIRLRILAFFPFLSHRC